jgi:spore maturation protein CgeB
MIIKIEGMKIAYYEGTYFGAYGNEFIVTNKKSLMGMFTMAIFDKIFISEFREAKANPATMAEIQEMGFSFGLHYPLKGG